MIQGEAEIQIPEIHLINPLQYYPGGADLYQCKIKLHTAYNQIQRETYQVLNYMGDVGGLMSIMNFIGLVAAHSAS